MPSHSPYKLLQIILISARDLPPLSKMLGTFAVAYVTPHYKLTTKIDHQGHTNPTWNYKMQFQVEEEFLKLESSTLTIEIYNLAWLRDLPIGTAHLNLNTLLSPPVNKNNASRRISLRVCRPTGHLKGTVNLAVQLLDIGAPDDDDIISLRDSEISADNRDLSLRDWGITAHNRIQETNDSTKQVDFQGSKKISDLEMKIAPKVESVCSTPESIHTLRSNSESDTRTVTSSSSDCSLMRPLPSEVAGYYRAKAAEYGSEIFDSWTEAGEISSDDRIPGPEMTPKSESVYSTSESTSTWRTDSESESRTVTSGGSDYSVMRPLPSEVADDLKRGYYRAEATDYGSEIFENWTEVGDTTSNETESKPEKGSVMNELTLDVRRKRPEKPASKGFKIFGINAYGLEFSFICGSNQMKMKNKKRDLNAVHMRAASDETLGKFRHRR